MNIVGFASLNHDPSVACLQDGIILAAIESEKVTRAKHEVNLFPERALKAVLNYSGLDLDDIDVIATNYDMRLWAVGFYVKFL
jgi:carbamoyltransferase